MDTGQPNHSRLPVTWWNVGIGFAVLLVDIVISYTFKLGVAKDLLIAALRCLLQLTLLGFILQSVFEAQHIAAVAALSFAMLVLGAIEVAFDRSKRRSDGLFTSVLVSLLVSVTPMALVGARFAIMGDPFWAPQSFIPVLGMLTGNAIGASAVANNYITKEVTENKDKLEIYLAFGASRSEACLPVARDALKLALLPTINQMSIIGLISIPGMMTGAILGGADVGEAARMQMIIMFLITACCTLCVTTSVFFLLTTLVDDNSRVRLDKLSHKAAWPSIIFNGVRAYTQKAGSALAGVFRRSRHGEGNGHVRI